MIWNPPLVWMAALVTLDHALEVRLVFDWSEKPEGGPAIQCLWKPMPEAHRRRASSVIEVAGQECGRLEEIVVAVRVGQRWAWTRATHRKDDKHQQNCPGTGRQHKQAFGTLRGHRGCEAASRSTVVSRRAANPDVVGRVVSKCIKLDIAIVL